MLFDVVYTKKTSFIQKYLSFLLFFFKVIKGGDEMLLYINWKDLFDKIYIVRGNKEVIRNQL